LDTVKATDLAHNRPEQNDQPHQSQILVVLKGMFCVSSLDFEVVKEGRILHLFR